MKRCLVVALFLFSSAARADNPGHPQGPSLSGDRFDKIVFEGTAYPLGPGDHLRHPKDANGVAYDLEVVTCAPNPNAANGNSADLICTLKDVTALSAAKKTDAYFAKIARISPVTTDHSQVVIVLNSLINGGNAFEVSVLPGTFDDLGAFVPPSADLKKALTLSWSQGGEPKDEKDWGDISKCLRKLHYTPTRDVKIFGACIRMMRADYDGNGKSGTSDGTYIFAYDNKGYHGIYPCNGGDGKKWPKNGHSFHDMWFEASWDEQGRVCQRHFRHKPDEKPMFCVRPASNALIYNRSIRYADDTVDKPTKRGGSPIHGQGDDPHCALCDDRDEKGCATLPDWNSGYVWPEP